MFAFLLVATFVAFTAAEHLPQWENRIIGGQNASISNYPYQLSIHNQIHICGAALISSKYALTAAHCIEGLSPSKLSVYGGVSDLAERFNKIEVKTIIQHPEYSSTTLDNDISILEFTEEIDLEENQDIKPIVLADDSFEPKDGTIVACTGWGASLEGGSVNNQLQFVNIKIVSRKKCREVYGTSKITEQMICAGIPSGEKDACTGDSGSPLAENGKLVGLVSWGFGCGRPGYPGIYSSIGALRSFIRDNTNV